jgi:hypothetical protein
MKVGAQDGFALGTAVGILVGTRDGDTIARTQCVTNNKKGKYTRT